MNTFRNKIGKAGWIAVSSVLFSLVVAPAKVLGVMGNDGGSLGGSGNSSFNFENPLRFNSVRDLLEEALKIVGYLGTIAAIFFFIYAGFLYVTAGGDPKKLEKAHATFKNTAIGTAILLGTSLIVSVITSTVDNIRGN